jgi:predicted acylesterase/phospholipase RssA
MLGRLRMKTDDAMRTYNTLAQAIFSKANKKRMGQDGMFKASTLESKVKELVADKKQGERMLPPPTSEVEGKAFVCAMPASNMEYPRLFRTYPVRALASANYEIWEAARATSAAPTFFKRITIDDGTGGKDDFVDGGLRCNNPTKQVLEEAKTLFGNGRPVGCLVSIGTGHPGTIRLARPHSSQNILPLDVIEVLKKIATDCEWTANELSSRFQDHKKFYYRFNVEHGAEGMSLEEWEKMDEMRAHTNAYMSKVAVSKAIDEVVEMLCQPRDMGRTLGSLGQSI